MDTSKKNPSAMVKLVAALLGFGGAAGVGVVLWTYITLLWRTGIKFSATNVLFGVFVLVFGWSTWTGIDLWKGRPRAYKWAKLLFLLQTPSISIAGFAYQFYTGLMLCLSFNFGDVKLGFEFQLASAIVFQISSSVEDSVLGVNLVALAALVYLIYASRQVAASDSKLVASSFSRGSNLSEP